MRALKAIGMDRAVAYTFLARTANILGSVGTVLLIVRFLSPVEQGYYYTLLSLAALQTIFELGFSFVILQLAAHESALLRFESEGRIEGDPGAHARLASVLQLTLRWYLRAAVLLAALLLPLGIGFFSVKQGGQAGVAWLGPWIAAVGTIAMTFVAAPLCSFLEGCNQVGPVARLRALQAVSVLVISWAAVASGQGLYACALVNLGWSGLAAGFLFRRRAMLMALLRHRTNGAGISWSREIWPFQWKIAVSWLCSYFMMQVFTPILFSMRGPEEAGRMGLSLSVAGYLPIVALCWILPKAAPFGQLVKSGRLNELDALFFRTLRQSLALILLLAGACFALVLSAQRLLPSLAARMERPWIFALLLATAVGSFVVQSMAVYLRSFKREPFLVQSMTVAGLTLAGIFVATPRWGSAAVALVYFATSGVVGMPWAVAIFHARRTARIQGESSPVASHAIPAVLAGIGASGGGE